MRYYEHVYRKKVHLTAAQILTLNSAPVELIPAPGVGKAVSIVDAIAVLNFVSVAFNFIGPDHGYLTTQDSNNHQIKFFGFIGAPTSTNVKGILEGTYLLIQENTHIVFYTEEDITVGDSTIDIYIAYRIVTL